MKIGKQWIAALFMAASSGLAWGFVCSSETVLVSPVREYVVEQPSPNWGTPFHVIGNVISAPFVALGNAFSPSTRYVEPVGERFTTRTYYHTRLMPVGERFTTVKIIRSRSALMPVGERFTTVKTYHKKMLKPVGERFITVKSHHKAMLNPVGEKITTIKYIKMTPVLEPVGERTIIRTTRVYSQPWWSCD